MQLTWATQVDCATMTVPVYKEDCRAATPIPVATEYLAIFPSNLLIRAVACCAMLPSMQCR